jgi:hypothetical protein
MDDTAQVSRPPAAGRLLRQLFGPAPLVSAVLVFNAVAPEIAATVNPFRPQTLQDYMVEVYHQHFCATHDPSTPINPAVWRMEEPVLVRMAMERMRDDRRKTPHPEIPILPTAPILPPAPGQAPLLPCCAGEGLSAVLSRRSRRGPAATSKASSSLNT